MPPYYLGRLLRYAERCGEDVRPLLREAGIAPDIASRPRGAVTPEQMARFTQALWDHTGDELWGLGRAPVPRGTFHLLCIPLVHARDLRGVVARFERATKVLPGVPEARAVRGGRLTRIEIDLRGLDNPEHLGADLISALLHRVAGWLIGRRIPLRLLELPCPAPPYVSDYEQVFGRIPVFGAPAAVLGFDSVLLEAPVVRDEADLAGYIREAPHELFRTRDCGSARSDQVRRILEEGLRGHRPDSAEVAARLGMSPQHLRRLLREEGTSMSGLRQEILRDAVITSLLRGDESVEELAARLGYSEASALRRAFRRWTGAALGAYRPGASLPG
ncbi:AraC family transcriptional regulator [Streptomyces physcomitrii]|uniref:AraC family transcriptional regulator n=1 Tax=Streptomyces physcomitrii TaxID=2724184 RepID=UPI00069866E6